MTSGTDIGAYMLGASIAKGNAESLARIRAQKAEREHAAEIGSYEERLSRIYGWYAEADIFAEVRRRARSLSKLAALEVLKRAQNGQITISVEEFEKLFAHEIEKDAKNRFFIDNAREHVEEFVKNAPNRTTEIRAALARIESLI